MEVTFFRIANSSIDSLYRMFVHPCQRAPQNRPPKGAPKPARGLLRKRVVIGWVWAGWGSHIPGGGSGWFSVRLAAGVWLSFPDCAAQFLVRHLRTP
jgi:hypothetical protein